MRVDRSIARRAAAKRLAVPAAALAVAALGLSACGTQRIAVAPAYQKGALLFLDHCSGCHTLSVVGAEGSATSIKDRLRTNGPNFDFRKEQAGQVLYAIRAGGFSSAIMPQNIVLGAEAQAVAEFLAKYSGLKAPKVPVIEHSSPEGASASTSTAATTAGK
jgi:mono/diheme cytochrome c family protein